MVVTIYSVPHCDFCAKAVDLCYKNLCDVAIRNARDVTRAEWIDRLGEVPKTAPQIFIGSEYIGGYKELKEYFERRAR